MARHDVTSIEVDRLSHVQVDFDDGVSARFELAPLRSACPCAECNSRRQRGEPVSRWLDDGKEVTIISAELAGNWGLSLDWSDGHSTGIYAWTALRQWIDDDDVSSDGRPDGSPDEGPNA